MGKVYHEGAGWFGVQMNWLDIITGGAASAVQGGYTEAQATARRAQQLMVATAIMSAVAVMGVGYLIFFKD